MLHLAGHIPHVSGVTPPSTLVSQGESLNVIPDEAFPFPASHPSSNQLKLSTFHHPVIISEFHIKPISLIQFPLLCLLQLLGPEEYGCVTAPEWYPAQETPIIG